MSTGPEPEQGRPAPHHPVLGAWWVLPIGLVVALALLSGGGLRGYGYAMAATLVVAAIARATASPTRAGGLVVRSRTLDVATLLLLALGIAVLAANLVIR